MICFFKQRMDAITHKADMPESRGIVIPVHAGLQEVPGMWSPACAGMTLQLYSQVPIATGKMPNTL
jgi:hypothetical protein